MGPLKLMLDILDILVDTMLVTPDTLEVMVTTLASVKPKLNLKLMLDILVDISVDSMVVIPDTSEAMVTTLASAKPKLMLDISDVDTMVVMVASVDSIVAMLAIVDKLFNIRLNYELFNYDKIYTFNFNLNKLDK